MNTFEEPAGKITPGMSRRQMLRRFSGGLVGAMLAGLGLARGKSYGQTGRVVSLRALVQRMADCDPSHGIRIMLPDDRPVISIRDVIRRFWPR